MDNSRELLETYRELNQTYKTRDTEHFNRVLSQKWLIILGFGSLSVLVLSVVINSYKITWQLSSLETQNQRIEQELRDSQIEELAHQIKSLEASINGSNSQQVQREIEQLKDKSEPAKSPRVETCSYFLGIIKTKCQKIQ
jgi:hypothetical protein